jgi:Uma2 family endonuclease
MVMEQVIIHADITLSGKILATGVSQDEFMAGYEGLRVEWVNGAVIEMPSINERHDALIRFLDNLFEAFLKISGGGRVLQDPMIMRIPDVSSRAPDIQILLPHQLDQLQENIVIGAASLVIEVVSPGSQRTDRVDKYREYEQGGVLEYWLLDPEYKEALFFQRDDKGLFQRHSPDSSGIYHSKVLAGLRLPVHLLWQETLPDIFEIVEMVKKMHT